MTAALELCDLTVRFGGLVALDAVSLAIGEGSLVGLIGPNGAGKTTLIDAVTGFVPHQGSVLLGGERMDRLRPDQRAGRGLGRTFQALDLFEDLSVMENASVSPASTPATVDSALAMTGLLPVAAAMPAGLSPSTRRLVALARTIAAQPRVVLLDELAAGLDGGQRTELAGRIRAFTGAGSTALIVDHDLGFVTDLVDRVVVLDAGHVVADGPPAEIRRDPRVLAAYLGRDR